MLSLFLSTLLVTATLAATPCCIDRQFEAVMGEIGGATYSVQGKPTSTIIESTNIIHYDYYSKMMAVEATSVVKGNSYKSDIIINMSTDDMYVTTSGHCTQSKSSFTSPFIEPCIPDDAKLVGSSYIGFGFNAINFTTWQFSFKGVDEDVRLSVTDDGCIPIAEGAFGTVLGYKSDVNFIITNFQPGIRKHNIFNIPQHCTAAPQAPGDVPEHLRRTLRAVKKIVTFR